MTELVTIDRAIANRAGALLLDAAGMLRMEASEWRDRMGQPPKDWTRHASATDWKEKCERVASINISAATSMAETAKKIAEAVA